LRDTHAQTQTEIEGLQREIGALAQRLADHDKLSQQRSEHAAALTAQKQRHDRVAVLHALIGSADGKKYRNFAQGLTFERMVRAANHHLHRMTDRYTLARDTQQPLLLNVVDHYQGDVLRVTRNLSGGESFIVSLALALGLSQLSSRNVRLDSLFLDEGFGTLSEEVLETALSTLSSLHQEGKRIGVISHVQALKDRISTQIVVYPESGGRSGVEGPGVFRVS
jgi:exonuclease SbcC